MSGVFSHRYITYFNKIVKHSKTIALVEKEPSFFIKSTGWGDGPKRPVPSPRSDTSERHTIKDLFNGH